MKAVEALLILAVLVALVVWFGVSLVGGARSKRAPWALREESDGDAMRVLAVKPGQQPLLVSRVPFDAEDFDSALHEARAEGRARVGALNSR